MDFDNSTFDQKLRWLSLQIRKLQNIYYIWGENHFVWQRYPCTATHIHRRRYIITNNLTGGAKETKSETYVFTNKGNHEMMKQKDISAGLTSSFRKAGMEQSFNMEPCYSGWNI